MNKLIKYFVGLDFHKDTNSVSVCETGREASRFVGTIRRDLPALPKVFTASLTDKPSKQTPSILPASR